MGRVLTLQDLPSHAATQAKATKEKGAATRVAQARGALAGKRFSQLTPPEKDDLLEALAVQAGLIDPEE